MRERFQNSIGHFLGAFSSNNGVACELSLRAHTVKGNKFVLEGGYFNFEKILPILKMYKIKELKDNFILIGLVQNQKTPEEFFNDLRRYDTEEDWTYNLNDEDLRDVSQEAIPFSLSMTAHLTQYGFTIYDTSTERERLFDTIIDDIKSQLV